MDRFAPPEHGNSFNPEPQSLRQRLPKIALIRKLVEKRFGPTFDESSQKITNKPYDEINLSYNCGEISRIAGSVVGGDVQQKVIRGHNPVMTFINDDGEQVEIASGNTQAIHSYVVDENDMVWDPITEIWGTMPESEFLDRIIEA